MSKSITIKEGGQDRTLTVDKLRTALSGGGSCLWIPEDSAKLGTKTINENGTYKASDDSLYGYSEVTVRGVGVASGKDNDGHDVVAYTDPVTGKITTESSPESISIVTPPTKTAYLEGETIDFTGLTVRALMGDGSAYDAEGYPGGMIPIGELTFPVTVAHASGAGKSAESDLVTNLDQPIPLWAAGKMHEWRATSDNLMRQDYYSCDTIFTTRSGGKRYYARVSSQPGYTRTYRIKDSKGQWGEWKTADVELQNSVTIDGKTAYYYRNFTIVSYEPEPEGATPFVTSIDENSIWTAIYGTIHSEGRMEVTVEWNRPYDGKTLATSFEIDVTVPEAEPGSPHDDPTVYWEDVNEAINLALMGGDETVYFKGQTYSMADAVALRDSSPHRLDG